MTTGAFMSGTFSGAKVGDILSQRRLSSLPNAHSDSVRRAFQSPLPNELCRNRARLQTSSPSIGLPVEHPSSVSLSATRLIGIIEKVHPEDIFHGGSRKSGIILQSLQTGPPSRANNETLNGHDDSQSSSTTCTDELPLGWPTAKYLCTLSRESPAPCQRVPAMLPIPYRVQTAIQVCKFPFPNLQKCTCQDEFLNN
ncbi:unnamed protein product [Protopolystoma xenopodis]|uniref:Uncharacterized protein n=1 Tax=Protopolystoma xenopodis TaxID=117903 RepID=A0A448WAB9_9PLAT|nr:unnamed protein product [Protopolystoma xenopodis]